GLGEAVAFRRAAGPRLDFVGFDLDGEAARTADEMVVVSRRRARPVEGFAFGALQGVGLSDGGQTRKSPIDGGESDAGVLVAERRVQRLGAHETGSVGVGLAHAFALPRVSLGHARESTGARWTPPGSVPPRHPRSPRADARMPR